MPIPRRSTLPDAINTRPPGDYWAKTKADGRPGLSVRDHCLNVGCVAEAFLERLPAQVRELVPRGVITLLALHDAGKISPGFQAKCPAWLAKHGIAPAVVVGCEADHARVTQFTLQTLLGDRLWMWAAVAGAHHGRIKGQRVGPPAETNGRGWAGERAQLIAELTQTFGDLPNEPAGDAVLWFVAGMMAVADWIGSDEKLFPQTWTGTIDERRQLARDAVESVGWGTEPAAKPGLRFADLFPSFQPTPLQAAAQEHISAPGLYVIEGPMGCGKTEAALSAAYRLMESGQAAGIYFALPTQVTSNRIHLRVRAFLERTLEHFSEVRLIHSGSMLVEAPEVVSIQPSAQPGPEGDENARSARSWFSSAKRAILARFGVGTVDQALLGIVAAKHFFVRQMGLTGKIVILDEVHTYDLYTSTLIDTLIRRLLELRCTVVILSATLTNDRRRQLLGEDADQASTIPYPLLSVGGVPPREICCDPPPPKDVAVCFPSPDRLTDSALDRARRGDCVLWIRNTVDEAQETYSELKSASLEGGSEIALLHSRFPQFRREELENDWMDRLGPDGQRRPQNGCVLVSTQVAEQSVDIDADLLITDIAPTDMLLQRLGRLWRHERPRTCRQAEVWIRPIALSSEQLCSASANELQEALGRSARVYDPYVLLRSWQQWRHRDAITLPGDIRPILEGTYAAPGDDEPPAWRELHEELEKGKAKLGAKALIATNVWFQPSLPDDEGVQTRYRNYPTASLLVARRIEALDAVSVRLTLLNGDMPTVSGRSWNIEAARALHRNLVRMPRWAVHAGLGAAPDWSRLHVAEPTAIGVLQPGGAIVFWRNDVESGLTYCPERGILIAPGKRPATAALEEWDEDESYD